MARIPDMVIDEIQARADIAELIGRYVPLKRAGQHFKANCPFHKEKTPSFMVNTNKQIFHCFGCGVGGNIFSFLMQHDRLTFPEAVRQVADQVGVAIPEQAPSDNARSLERLATLMEKVCGYFERNLQAGDAGKSAQAYLRERGLSEATQRTFRLGLAPAGWDHLLQAAGKTGVTPEQLEGAGLLVKGKSGYYDRFRHRLMFSIVDVRGRVVGFGGRSLDAQEPKYLNSPETALYTKGRHLFGLAQAKEAILKTRTAVLVEGYFDCVVLSGVGIAHVVSPLGTALTADQARLLKRYAEQVVLAFDPDAAGETATLRGIDLLVEAGLQVQVAQLPDGLDPDECVLRHGRERVEQWLANGVSILEFLLQMAVKQHPSHSIEQKVRAAQFVLPTIAKMPNAMLRSECVRVVGERLQLNEQAILEELAKVQPRSMTRPQPIQRQASLSQPVAAGPERLLTALLLDEPIRWKQVKARVSLDQIDDPSLRRVVGLIDELDTAAGGVTAAQVASRLSSEGQDGLVAELMASVESVQAKDVAMEECMRRLHTRSRDRMLEQLRRDLRTAEESGVESDVRRLLVAYQEQVKGG